MEKVLTIDGKNVGFRANALTPRLYRHKIGRDIIQDLNKLKVSYNKALRNAERATEEEEENYQLSVIDLEIFENVSFIMARQYDPTIPETAEEWLESFNIFSIYEILPAILELWGMNQKTTSVPKKKSTRLLEKKPGQHSCCAVQN